MSRSEAENRTPSYIALYESGELARRIEALEAILTSCTLCPRGCRVDRTRGETGVCRAGAAAMVSSASPHFGEEPPLVGSGGSGTIFMTHCNLRCVFCQNYDISQEVGTWRGEEVGPEELAGVMIALAGRGCHNINIVSPTHYVPQVVAALPFAVEKGLDLPLVYNTGGYDSIEVVRLLEGIFDIYMPDYKFTDSRPAERYMNAPDYPEVIQDILREMHRQVGTLRTDDAGIAYRGLLIRHLVMPNDAAGTAEAMEFIATELSSDSYVNVMQQYHPMYRAGDFPEIARRLSLEEYLDAVWAARRAGLSRGF
ncbi:MAG: radical SAM protein [Deltaproteobacteria bacterium]|nr:radical SAM protein [Candidatus Zymogenaceae bacterium]